VSVASEAFVAAFGRPPEGLWAAPGRVNLIGEHTDYNDGLALPVALPLRTVAAAGRASGGGRVRLASLQAPGEAAQTSLGARDAERLPQWARYAAGVLWAMADAGHEVGGVDVLIDGDVPLGSGLSSSAALGCSVALAADGLFGLELPRPELARLVQRADHVYAGIPSGLLDQMASLCCREGSALYLDFRTLASELVPLDLAAAGLRLLVIDTGVQRGLVGGEYAERRRSCQLAAAALGVAALRDAGLAEAQGLADPVLRRRARHVVTEDQRVVDAVELFRAGRVAAAGPLLTASHVSLRDDYEVSCPELDVAVEAVLAAGGLGARLTGAGFGGCAIALVEEGSAAEVSGAVTAAYDEQRWPAPRIFPMVPAAGATRIG
jgi:galactokinase